MRFKIACGLVFCVVVLCQNALTTAQPIEKPPVEEITSEIDWVFDYEQAKLESKRTDKPMFVVFRCER